MAEGNCCRTHLGMICRPEPTIRLGGSAGGSTEFWCCLSKLANSWSSWLICCSISCNYSRTSYATGGRWFELCAGAERILQLRMRGTQLLNWHGTPMLSFASRAKPIGIF